MPTDPGEKNIRRPTPGAPPPEQDQLPCPRCDSNNTKFCYYNNYNFSQPRHFCKGCRRYWTHGGTLRDIPVGGGTRKNAKRCRTNPVGSSEAAAGKSMIVNSGDATWMLPATSGDGSVQFYNCGGEGNKVGSFTSLLDSHGPGFFGYGLWPGYEEVGFGIGRSGGGWPYSTVADGGATVAGLGNTWQYESGGSGFVWPDLAISATRNGLE